MPLNKQTGKNPVEWMRKCSCGKLLSKNNIHCKNYPHPYMEKQWLSEQYWEKKHTMREMAKLSNSSYVTIWTWMKKHNISRRTNKQAYVLPEGNHVKLTDKTIEFLDGLLFGDGSLTTDSNISAYYEQADKHSSYIYWLSAKFKKMGMKQCGSIYIMNGHNKSYYRYKSLSYIELLPLLKRWYPNGKKKIPTDLIITPIILKYWYIGDGNFSRSPLIDSTIFSFEDLNKIVNQLREKNIYVSFKKYKDRKRIRICKKSEHAFFRYLLSDENEIPPGYRYKFPDEVFL